MADTWGSLALNVTDYNLSEPKTGLMEYPLVPDPSATSAQTVLMGTGRWRLSTTMKGWATLSDYQSLEADYYAQTTRTVTWHDGTTYTALIKTLDGKQQLGSDLIWYDAVFLEAA